MTFNFGLDAPSRVRSQFTFSFPRQSTPDRHDDLMMDSLFDFTQTTAAAALSAASLEQLLNTPVPFIDMTSEATQNLILNNHNNNTTITPEPAVVFNSSHAFRHHHRHNVLYTSFDELIDNNSNNNRTNRNNDDSNKKFDTRQEYYYPGLEPSSPYEQQLENPGDDLALFDGGIQLLDFGVENDVPFDVEEYQKLSMFVAVPANPKPEYTAIPSEVPLFPSSEQGGPVESAVVGMNVDDSSDDDDGDDECDGESDCDSDSDNETEVVAVPAPIAARAISTPIKLSPTPIPSHSPPSSSSPPLPSSVASQPPKLPRSRAKKGEKRVHVCPECLRVFTRACNLQSHILTHSNLKPHACSECDKTFARVYDMQRHKRIHSNKLEDKPYDCPDCSMRFKRTEPRNRHRQSVHGWAGK
ncbi:hypothetical protein BG015_008915 [Linnemannia schmuckeri]|uniref:C2H2-type domain-containing protein n=1 Tax=Linnemannia schmuckeri TaxID=64567 RepID=A0A9P5VA58_9FUNG|nr:hypothetical protein BG015_008915 [Linnemannia schmuckeri]